MFNEEIALSNTPVSIETLDACEQGYNQMRQQRDELMKALGGVLEITARIANLPVDIHERAIIYATSLSRIERDVRAALARVQS